MSILMTVSLEKRVSQDNEITLPNPFSTAAARTAAAAAAS
jgi:hypothetical protein